MILRVEVVLYTGKVGDPVKKSETDRLVKPRAQDEVRLNLSWEEYGPRLLSQCAFNIACLATVKNTNFEYFAQDDFRVLKPTIDIEVIFLVKNFFHHFPGISLPFLKLFPHFLRVSLPFFRHSTKMLIPHFSPSLFTRKKIEEKRRKMKKMQEKKRNSGEKYFLSLLLFSFLYVSYLIFFL